jgi:aldehyde dehydrogenase (NAD+)
MSIDAEIDSLLERMRANQPSVAGSSSAVRGAKLRQLESTVLDARQKIRDAVFADFRKPQDEADLTEIYPVVSEARFVAKNLRKWMKPRRVPTPLTMLGSKGWIQQEPKGVVLIIAPWNFPLMLSLGPLISAVAAGNCAVVKPSEHTPASSALIRELVASVFPTNEVAVVEGATDVAQALLSRKWDHIFFTGSTAVGRIVMEAAAKHLTPVTLELGGKSPAIVDRTANLDLAARRVAWGRCINGGQACVAPDYVLVEDGVESAFIDRLRRSMHELYPDPPDAERPMSSIVNVRHFDRIMTLIDDAKARGAEVVTGGVPDRDTLRIPPTVLRNVDPESKILDEEIFGPVLPVVTWRDRSEPLAIINRRPRPLALYVLTGDMSWRDEVLRSTTAGTSAVNDTMNQFHHHYLPFGGVGASGFGKGHGLAGFETFSNPRSVLQQGRLNSIDLLYPPYSPIKKKIAELLLRWF